MLPLSGRSANDNPRLQQAVLPEIASAGPAFLGGQMHPEFAAELADVAELPYWPYPQLSHIDTTK